MTVACRPDLTSGKACGALHAGVLTALADTAFGLALLRSPLALAGFATIDLSVEHAAVIQPGRSLIVSVVIDEVVNGVASLSGEIRDTSGERPLATARAGFALLEPGATGAAPNSAPPPRRPPALDERLLDGVPYAAFLGLRMSETEGRPLCRMPFRPELIGSPRLTRLHGGALAGLLEATAAQTLRAQAVRTRSVFIDFLRPAGPFDTFATGRVAAWNGAAVEIEVEAWQIDPAHPVATATIVLEAAPGSGVA